MILIVDDDPDVSAALAGYFAATGRPCRVINSAPEGLEAIQKGAFDLILLDIKMPGFSGFDILRMLAYGGVLREKNVIIITALDISARQKAQLKSAGVLDVLSKPILPEVLEGAMAVCKQS
ncbi:MAG: response regulator [Nitrososphaera sp.]|jgi:two-component system OmpR family response regulator